MLKSLRSRLLLSFIVVIVTTQVAILVAALIIGSLPAVRYSPVLRELDAISQVSRSELLRLLQSNASNQRMLRVLDETAVENNVRVLVAQASNLEVTYDTNNNEWVEVIIGGVVLPARLLPSTDENTLAGLFTHPDGSTWLVYSRAISSSGFGSRVVLYVRPEPTRFGLFRDLGLIPLLIGATVVSFILSILLALGIAGWVIRPLQRLAGATEAIAQGDYDQKLSLQGPEEVQRVATSFNSMAAQVAATRQAQRDFVANVSHDLKTPITSIQGWSQALLDGAADSPQAKEHAAGVINSEAERMSRMVRQLLDLAKIESGQIELQKEAVDLMQLVTDVYRNLSIRAREKQIHLTLDVEPIDPILGDPDRLMQVFTNLVDNALSHTPTEGRVHLDVHPHGEKAVEVVVQDTGKGIEAEELDRIFERFYQVDKSRTQTHRRTGSGLGLAIVHELVLMHNGRIFARSELDKGSVFVVRLPISDMPDVSTIVRRI
ncbi:MAG: HAMP domain-containing histidine kinase [Chloroflexi bacterium]|nr:HAMP domain-containing histidine kinase [Chloroflexota bacterium]